MSILLGVKRTEEGQGGQSTQILTSLFLILLCFFVLLVSHSASRKERSQAALGSVSQAFRGTSRDLPAPPPAEVAESVETIVKDLRERLVAGSGAVSLVDGGGEAALRLAVPRDRLFDRGDELVQSSDGLRRMTADAVFRETDGFALELEIAVDGASGTPERESLALDRIARDLIRRGVPPHRVSVSLEPGLGPGVRLSFFVRPVLPADVAFAGRDAPP